MDSIIPRFLTTARYLRNAVGSSASNPLSVQLNTDWLVDEYRFTINLSQTWGTNAPTSFEPRKVFSRVVLRSDKFGTHVDADFAAIYDLFRFYDNVSPVPVTAFGAGGGAAATAQFYFELNMSNDEAKRAELTALKTQDLGSLWLDLYPSIDTANGFVGGTGAAGVTAITVNADEIYLPYLSNAANSKDGYGECVRYVKKLASPIGNASASPYEIFLNNDNADKGHRTRAIMLQFRDTASGAFVDTVLDYVTIEGIPNLQGGIAVQNIHDYTLRQMNVQMRAFNQTGCYVIDFRDDENGWLSLAGIAQPKLKFQSKAGAPAAWQVSIHQDITTGLEQFKAVMHPKDVEVLRVTHANANVHAAR